MRRAFRIELAMAVLAALALQVPLRAGAQGAPFINFETIPTRALALSPDGTKLFVTNTPDSRLEIFNVTPEGLQPAGSVTVGLEPIAVAARSNDEVWVVNHVSDSVSIVDVGETPPHVARTLLVGDEPRDVVFAGPEGAERAFITAARRGQNHPADTVNETQRPGIGRADVWVFDANDPGDSLGGDPLTIVQLFADKPGAMTVSPDGRDVYVAIFTSGNQTTVINDRAVCRNGTIFSRQGDGPCMLPNGKMSPGGVLAPNTAQGGVMSPRVGQIVKFDEASKQWRDGAGRDFSGAVPFSLPDNDVFVIDAMASPPVQRDVFSKVGTLNLGITAHPTNGKTYVATIDAVNINRFLSVPRMNAFPNPNATGGVARTADPATGKTLNGHLYESRIAILERGRDVVSRHLNKHIDYEIVPSPPGVKERSTANPQGVTFSPDGNTLFVAALGSNQIVPFRTSALDDDSFQPSTEGRIMLSGNGGPTDLVLDSSGTRMFVYKRFDNAVSVIDMASRREMNVMPLFNPEPREVTAGRKFFYDATIGSSNGEASCAVCHPNADKDDLAWDFGAPFSGLQMNPNNFVPAPAGLNLLFPDPVQFNRFATGFVGEGMPTVEFNPLKGPMTVLTLRGIKDSGPMFWRGDATSNTPNDERSVFQSLGPVFEALLGRDGPLPANQMSQLSDWALSIIPPPNPHRPLNNQLNADQQAGMGIFLGAEGNTDVIFKCNDCHVLDVSRGFFGTAGQNVIEGEPQFFKVTQLRTVYDKVGMFGQTSGQVPDPRPLGGPRGNVGPQIRGTGTLHDGSDGGVEEFLLAPVFQLDARKLKQVTDFNYAFPTNLAPIVGQQVTVREGADAETLARLDLLQQRAAAPFMLPGNRMATECELIAKGPIGGEMRGFLFVPRDQNFLSDRGERIAPAQLRQMALMPEQELTFTCVYPGGGLRMGLDRDMDGRLDDGRTRAPNLPRIPAERNNPTPPGGNAGRGFLDFIRGFVPAGKPNGLPPMGPMMPRGPMSPAVPQPAPEGEGAPSTVVIDPSRAG